MRFRSIFTLAISIVVGVTCAIAKSKPKAKPDVLVVADVLADDSSSVTPTPAKPIYYVILGGMERDLGASIAGLPSVDLAMIRTQLVSALAGRSFIETKLGGPVPRLALVVSWGYANLDTIDVDETNTDDSGESTTSTTTYTMNAREKARLIGWDKAERHLMSSSEADELNSAYRDDRLYIVIAALDAAALQKKQKKLLWRTRISIDALREDLPSNLGMMIADAAPYFARDIDRPVTINDDVRRANVKLGELKFLDETPTPGKK